jgi:hypothetical protein
MARDAPVTGGDGTLPRAPARPERLEKLAKRYALTAAVKRLSEALAACRTHGRGRGGRSSCSSSGSF